MHRLLSSDLSATLFNSADSLEAAFPEYHSVWLQSLHYRPCKKCEPKKQSPCELCDRSLEQKSSNTASDRIDQTPFLSSERVAVLFKFRDSANRRERSSQG